MRKQKKIVFFIVEGVSDQTALAAILSEMITSENVIVEFTSGDITTRNGVNPQNIVSEIGNFVKAYSTEYFYTQKDYQEIVQIVDMDGAFIEDKFIVREDTKRAIYYEDRIGIDEPDRIIDRNSRKKSNLERLIGLNQVWGSIPYSVYFFSSNLDHVLHNDANLPDSEKDKYATRFAKKYVNDKAGFLHFINGTEITSESTFAESWDYIRKEKNSLSRCTNLPVFLSTNAKSVKRSFDFN